MSGRSKSSSDAASAQQLDIFLDSRDVMLRNEVTDAIGQRDLAAVRACISRLAAEYPTDHLLAPARLLADALVNESSGTADTVPSEQLQSVARDVLGNDAGRAWLKPLWRVAAVRRAHEPWTSSQPEAHAAPMWLAAGDWPEAIAAVSGIASWRRIPDPLCWMTHARWRLDGLDDNWPLIAELAWLSPRRFHALIGKMADPVVDDLRRRFDREFDPADNSTREHGEFAWFPAWVLSCKPVLAQRLAPAQPGQDSAPERGLRLMLQLLVLEKLGNHRELMARRQSLSDLCRPLYDAYMATR